jgi:hypothetical protein
VLLLGGGGRICAGEPLAYRGGEVPQVPDRHRQRSPAGWVWNSADSSDYERFDILIVRDGGVADLLAEAAYPGRRFDVVIRESAPG